MDRETRPAQAHRSPQRPVVGQPHQMRRAGGCPVRRNGRGGYPVGAAVPAADAGRSPGRPWRTDSDPASRLCRVNGGGTGGKGGGLVGGSYLQLDAERFADPEHQPPPRQRVAAEREETVVAADLTTAGPI